MDEFLDHFFSSSSWSEANVAERASWIDNGPSETNGILPDSLGAYNGNGKNSPIPLIPSSHIIESLTTQGTSMLGGGGISNYGLDKGLLPGDALTQNYGLDKGLLHGDALTQKEGLHCEANSSLPGMVNGNCKYMGVHLTNSTPNLSTVNHSSPELLSVVGSSAKSPHAPIESGSVGSNDSETSGFQPCLRDSQPLTSIPQLWPSSSYGDVSSLSPVMAQDKLPIFGLQGEYMDTDANGLGNRYLGDDKILQMGNLPASVHVNGHGELNNHCLSSFSTGQHNQLADMVGLHSQSQLGEGNTIKHYTDLSSVSQLPNTPAVAAGVCNGAAKPRMRARRGQATDPHSIAERLRREKISERMKNLQELVPNSNKTDKASMLDEIIEYVKFLQLQVKVLSMSRLGAAGAVVPLITDTAEGSTGLLLSQSDDQGSDPPLESPDYLSFEQEVVKLMESDVTIAMQFLQSKGLCIMPMALAAALSGSEALSCSISVDKKKPIFKNGPVHQNNGPGFGTNQMNSDGNDTAAKENVTGIGSRECIPANGCNGTVIKQEEVNNSTCNARELKP